VGHLLAFSRQGWNAFKDYRARGLRRNAAVAVDFFRAENDVSPAEMWDRIHQYLAVKDYRSVRREIAKGREFHALFDIANRAKRGP
jgi:hypothetical protein